jgi:hypothetical protein
MSEENTTLSGFAMEIGELEVGDEVLIIGDFIIRADVSRTQLKLETEG